MFCISSEEVNKINSIENKRKDEIVELTKALLEKMPNRDMALTYAQNTEKHNKSFQWGSKYARGLVVLN